MPWLWVAADDRTGALEVAGMCAAAGTGPVAIDVLGARGVVAAPTGVAVTDIASRHLAAGEAARRAVAAPSGPPPARRAHKIDSTLRGNWAAEVAARIGVGGRVLVVPAFPAVGRTCVRGEVLVDGIPLADSHAGADARTPVRSGRVADHLGAAGLGDVVELATGDEVLDWASGRGTAAVCDAADDAALDAVAAAWARQGDLLLAGPAGAVVAGARAAMAADGLALAPRPPVVLDAPVVVACGSLHPVARRQVAELLAAGAGDGDGSADRGVVVLATPAVEGQVDGVAAGVAAVALAARVGEISGRIGARTIVVLGGDTAAAVLGDAPRLVGGTVAAGTPWILPAGDSTPVVVTRAGGFGGPLALVELLGHALRQPHADRRGT